MTIRKLGPLPSYMLCRSPQHDIPPRTSMHYPVEPGFYEHRCPACGRKVTFTVYPNAQRTKK